MLSSRRQDELTNLLDRVLALPAVAALKPDSRTRRVHYDWMEAGEQTQRTVAALSQQLRRFLDDQVWLENRRIMDILHGIESKALAVRTSPPAGSMMMMMMEQARADIELSMERTLFTSAAKPVIDDLVSHISDDDIDAQALFDQVVVDKAQLIRHIRRALQDRTQITLSELVSTQPLENGLAELVAYLQLGSETFKTVADEQVPEPIRWQTLGVNGQAITRSAQLPRVIFTL